MARTYYPLTDIKDISSIFQKTTLFGSLKDAQLQSILQLLKTVKYDEGEYIYKRGEPASFIYVIKHGEVKMLIDDEQVFIEVATFKDGDCFGETSVIGIQSHSSNAYVSKPTELIVIEPKGLLGIYEIDKEVFSILILNVARETARRLHQANESLVKYMLLNKKSHQ